MEVLPSGTANCTWSARQRDRLVTVAAYAHRDFLVDAYRNRPFPIFVPTTVSELPAAIQQSSPSAVTCTVTTGVAEGQGLDVSVGQFSGGDSARRSCEEALAVSAAVISNLPPAS